ncbi:hypothetical protein MHK_009993 [Candidatus Magnetomorum sp. HK-1]|nr:hypothetical protein MHK_009993 [Candidatus Magnetomorum sp. HK-1]
MYLIINTILQKKIQIIFFFVKNQNPMCAKIKQKYVNKNIAIFFFIIYIGAYACTHKNKIPTDRKI